MMRRNHAYHELNYHLVFVTKNREKWLDRAALKELRESFSEKAKGLLIPKARFQILLGKRLCCIY
ncbi:MAG: transposase, partial [Leptospiraceae bacterium]|nr:transposase [Leptospiraceae bacterium]